MAVAEDAAADAQHNRPVPPHQRREGRLVPLRDEALQQLAVGHPGVVVEKQRLAEVPQNIASVAALHVARSVARQKLSLPYTEE